MDHDAAVAWVDAHAWRGVKPGLERMKGLVGLLGDPHEGYPVVHVAGTNGKTTVARLTTAILIGQGVNAGTFTSPHLHTLEDRFQVGLEPITPDGFVALVSEVQPIVDLYEDRAGEGPTYFELTALLAFTHFTNEAVDAAVVEVGLGGRLDATNVLHGDVAVVTSIGLDHTEYLGDDLASIAGEKVAIAKEGSVLVSGPLAPEAEAVVASRAEELGLLWFAAGRDFHVDDAREAVGGWVVDVSGIHATYPELFLPLHGRHQIDNLAVAVATAEAFFGRALAHDDLLEAVAVVTNPGRLEVVGHDPLVLVDGAHNVDGIDVTVLAAREEFAVDRWAVVFAAMADKDLDTMIAGLDGFADEVFTTSVDAHRSATPEELATRSREVLPVPVTAVADPHEALAAARASVGPDGGVLVAGSLYLVGELSPRGTVPAPYRPEDDPDPFAVEPDDHEDELDPYS